MVDPLNAWWSQQLVLCGWAFEPGSTPMTPEQARAQLERFGVGERGELGWRLLEAFPAQKGGAQEQLAALELLALALAAGWLDNTQATAWCERLAQDIQSRYTSLDAWLRALRDARLEQGWARGDEHFARASAALAQLEQDGDGVTWPMLGAHLESSRQTPLWPQGEATLWQLRAVFAPVLASPPMLDFDWPEARQWLDQVWQIRDRDELVRVMLWLASQGHRYGWDLDVARLLEQDGPARQDWLSGLIDRRRYGEMLLGFIARGETLEWAAWDWLRLVDLAYAGWLLDWLSAAEAEEFAAHAADLLMGRYSDWFALARAYQRGRLLFEGQSAGADAALDDELNLLLYSSVSPWQVPLRELLDAPRREASRQAMRRWRDDPRHWLLALASIREPELLYRQGPTPEIAEPRRQDARHYLAETLGLAAEEGTGALRRYWLPAQAHYLNQLAADAAHGTLPALQTPFGQPTAAEAGMRQRLGSCARHAATVHMAEKYAFYLLMAQDSGDFDEGELSSLVQGLRSVLCQLYADSRRLLDAWSAWEAALADNAREALTHEIVWHRNDPGSCFHWLEWSRGVWQEPGPRPSLTRFTALALSGPLNPGVWGEPQREGTLASESERQWLDSHYGLQDAQALREFIDFLLEAGDRQDYQINYAPYTLNRPRLEEEIAILESADCNEEERNHLLRLRRIRDNEQGCNDCDMTAWDLAQAIDLAIAGRSLGWLDARIFGDILDRALEATRHHYGNWQDYATGLYAGFAFFMGETDERETFLNDFRGALVAWLTGAPPLAGPWACLDFPGARPRHWTLSHLDTLPGDRRVLH